MNRKFKVKVRYTFKGYFTVRAASSADAARLVSERCGAGHPNIRCTLDDDTCTDWCFPLHPDMQILSAKRFRRDK